MQSYQEYRFQFSCANMWQGNRVKALICDRFPQMPADDVFVENWTGAIDPPAVLVVVNIGTDSKEDWEEIQGQMEAIALQASKHVSLISWVVHGRGWDWVPPTPPKDNRIKVKTLDIKTAAGSLIARIEIGEELKVRVDRTVFGSTEDEMLVVLGDGEVLEGFDLPISKWG